MSNEDTKSILSKMSIEEVVTWAAEHMMALQEDDFDSFVDWVDDVN